MTSPSHQHRTAPAAPTSPGATNGDFWWVARSAFTVVATAVVCAVIYLATWYLGLVTGVVEWDVSPPAAVSVLLAAPALLLFVTVMAWQFGKARAVDAATPFVIGAVILPGCLIAALVASALL